MMYEHLGARPRIHDTAVVAPTAVISGDVQIGPNCQVLHGAVITAEGGPITLGEHVIVMENALIRATAANAVHIGDHTLVGTLAILACAPRELHDIGLIAFGLVLRSHGWRIFYLGANTPVETLAEASRALKSQLVVVAGMDGALLEAVGGELRRLARSTRLVLSGLGASEELCARLRVDRLDGDLVSAAEAVART